MRTSLLVAAVLLFAACDATDVASPSVSSPAIAVDAHGADAPDGQTLSSLFGTADGDATNRELAAARRATARYHRVDQAVDNGWGDPVISECVAHPVLGGMGHHYVNLGLMDGALDPATPEVLLYEPTRNGRFALVGVEYVVPFGVEPRAADGGTAPTLFGQSFHESEGAGGWALHVWVWKNNPAGMFADFNPRVSCDHAAAPGE